MKIERTSNMVNKLEKSPRNHTLSCNEGSIRLRPEWHWRRSEINNCSRNHQCSTGYLLFGPPPPAKHTFHRSSDQWIDCGNWWRFSFILHKWIAPSSSRCICCESRRRNVTFFDTSYSEKEFPLFNIGPIPSFHGNDSWWRASRFSSLWFCFCLWSACKIIHIQL